MNDSKCAQSMGGHCPVFSHDTSGRHGVDCTVTMFGAVTVAAIRPKILESRLLETNQVLKSNEKNLPMLNPDNDSTAKPGIRP